MSRDVAAGEQCALSHLRLGSLYALTGTMDHCGQVYMSVRTYV